MSPFLRPALCLMLVALPVAGCASGRDPTADPDLTSSPIAIATERIAQSGVPEEPAAPDQSTTPDRTVEESGGFKLAPLSSAECTAEGPADWTMTAPDRSDRADLFSPDGSMYAGYGILAINTTLQGFASVYDPPMNDPALYSDDPRLVAEAYGRVIVGAIGGAPDIAALEVFQPTPDYLLMTVAGSTHRGAIFHRASGFPGDGVNYSYALPMYFAFATLDRWESHGALVARTAVSIRCITVFQPPDDYPIVEAAPAGAAGNENGDDAGYNPQLGTEPVNDPTTGQNYLVDPSVNWSENGPDGPGYYVYKGVNDYQKLEPGRAG